MPLEARLMIIEVFYLWRALPFCSEEVKLQMMEMLDMALPADAQPFHKAMRAWLRGGVLNLLKRPREAEKVSHVTVMWYFILKLKLSIRTCVPEKVLCFKVMWLSCDSVWHVISLVYWLQSLREALLYEPDIKHDKHILSFSLYELATIHIANTEVYTPHYSTSSYVNAFIPSFSLCSMPRPGLYWTLQRWQKICVSVCAAVLLYMYVHVAWKSTKVPLYLSISFSFHVGCIYWVWIWSSAKFQSSLHTKHSEIAPW